MKSIEERIKDAEDGLPVPYYKFRELEAQNAELRAESEKLQHDIDRHIQMASSLAEELERYKDDRDAIER